jgi:bifunctional non-homologous end joining protein LigD
MARVKATGSNGPAKVQFIEPMYALAIQKLPNGPEWLYEVKFDGYRCLAGRDKKDVTLWSRRGNLFTKQFPEIARACERLPTDTLLDGEVIALDQNGRISFNLLQHHRSQAQALLFYAFDILIYRGENMMGASLVKRRKALGNVFDDLGNKAAPIFQTRLMPLQPSWCVW